uniref:Scaffolding protein n=1 Tax=viral metagenome TaxID=1070528 RepID=A0A6M3J135_9ZZZZ
MPEEPTKEATPVEEKPTPKEGAQDGQAAKPADEAKVVPVKTLQRVEQHYQKELSAANKDRSAAHGRVAELEGEIAKLREELEERPYGDDDDAKQARRKLTALEKQLGEREKTLSQREQDLTARERAWTAVSLAVEYGIPQESIEEVFKGCTTTVEFENRALKWEREHRDGAKPANTPARKPVPPPGGEQQVPRRNVMDMSSDEFNKYYDNQMKRAIRQRRQ